MKMTEIGIVYVYYHLLRMILPDDRMAADDLTKTNNFSSEFQFEQIAAIPANAYTLLQPRTLCKMPQG